jgi:ubiquinone/menaquinone biosynthesis C-methylase UbiE
MSLWGRIFATAYDRIMSGAEEGGLAAHRRALLASASGDVLEIGGGTGANLPFYRDGVRSLTITEPESPMAQRLERRLARTTGTPAGARLVQAPAERLPFDDESFDTIVSTLVLCTVDDQAQSLRELKRVLRPGGRLLFMEHVRAEDGEPLARWQDRMRPINVRMAHGCRCNRRTVDGIRDAGFEVTDLERDEMTHVPPFVRPLVVGAAATA